jgi:hypothetical protein
MPPVPATQPPYRVLATKITTIISYDGDEEVFRRRPNVTGPGNARPAANCL